MGVTRFLVSGTEEELQDFNLAVCTRLNAIERREDTVFYTCMGEDRDEAIRIGMETGVTMQEMDKDTTNETWSIVVQGEHPGWRPS